MIRSLYTRKSIRGFTLLEMLIYISILLLITVAVINVMLNLSRSFNSLKVSEEINRNAANVLERVIREVRKAGSVDVPGGVLSVHPATLSLNSFNESGNPYTVRIYIENGRIVLEEGSNAPQVLTQEGVDVTAFVVTHAIASSSEAVYIDLSLTRTRGSITKTEHFHTGGVLRRGYE